MAMVGTAALPRATLQPALGDAAWKVAVTLRAWVTVTVHPKVPVQAPVQPANTYPGLAEGLRETTVPLT